MNALCEVSIQNCLYTRLYWCRIEVSKTKYWIWKFSSNFENHLFTIIVGDFNARPSARWTRDKTTTEHTQLESLTTVHGLHQLISKPTHLLPQSSSCIDLMFTEQPNLIVDSGVHHLYIQTATIRLYYLHAICTYLIFFLYILSSSAGK